MLYLLTMSKWIFKQQILSPIFSTRSRMSFMLSRSAATQRLDFFSNMIGKSRETGDPELVEARRVSKGRLPTDGNSSENFFCDKEFGKFNGVNNRHNGNGLK
jgi:hypothetical protein